MAVFDKWLAKTGTAGNAPVAAADYKQLLSSSNGDSSVNLDILSALNAKLTPVTYLNGGSALTQADLQVFAAVRQSIRGLDEKTRATVPAVVRWADHIQHIPAVQDAGATGGSVVFVLPPTTAAFDGTGASAGAAATHAPASAVDSKSKKDHKSAEPATVATSASSAVSSSAASASSSSAAASPASAAASAGGDDAAAAAVNAKRKEERKKDKASATKDEKKKERPLSKKELAALQLPIAKLELRVGRIVSAKPHPADAKLYVEDVDIGSGVNRTVVSTFADYFPLSTFAAGNVLCVVATNLEVADIKGVKSTGRIFDVQKDGKKEWLTVPAGAKVGERITFAGTKPEEADKEIAAKKFRELLKELTTNDAKVALWRDVPFTTSAGVCTAATFTGAKIG